MKILGVIPARYNSTRFPGKPLVDICGKPMIWWVYNQAIQSKLKEIVVATDDSRIAKVCDNFNIPYIMTNTHQCAIDRIQEVSELIKADYYVQINGDEPLIQPNVINKILINNITQKDELVVNLITKIKEVAQALCPTNIKIVFNKNLEALYMSRTPIPNPYKSVNFSYYKHIGILAYNKKALDFFSQTPPGILETIEGLETLRFLEHKKKYLCIKVPHYHSISVDTPKDLEFVLKWIKRV